MLPRGNHNRHHSVELRTQWHAIGQHKYLNNEQHRPHQQTGGELGCSRRGSSSCFLLIYIAKSGKSLGSHRGQADCDDAVELFVAMNSTQEQHSLVLVAFATADEVCPENHCTEHKL